MGESAHEVDSPDIELTLKTGTFFFLWTCYPASVETASITAAVQSREGLACGEGASLTHWLTKVRRRPCRTTVDFFTK